MTNEEFVGKTPTPESLIRISLKHLEETEKSSDYVVEMGSWHYDDIEVGKCGICLGSSVLVFGLGMDLKLYQNISWERRVSHKVRNRVMAIDRFRTGRIKVALELLGCWHPWETSNGSCKEKLEAYRYSNIPHYSLDARHFKKEMHNTADKLEEFELLINTKKGIVLGP